MSNWSALLIDTNIFIKTNYNFEGGHLERLKSFRYRPETIIFDDIVCGEIISNFSKSLVEKSQILRKSTREAFSGKLIDKKTKISLESLLLNEEEASARAKESVDDFIDECGAVVINTHQYSDIQEIIKDYFQSSPPFGIREIKKHEFPDALCLNAVLAWAIEENKKVVLVSEDQGWAEYAELYSDQLKVVNSISEALDMFQEFDAKEFYSKLVRGRWADVRGEVEGALEQAIFSGIVEEFVTAEASSFLSFDSEIDDVVVDEVIFKSDGETLSVSLVEAPENGFEGDFYISIVADVSYTVAAIFSFSVYDSIDKDVVNLGGFLKEVSLDDTLELIVCLNFEDDTLNFCNAIVSGLPTSIYFGDVEPDFS